MAMNATNAPQLYVTIEGLRAQIIANATMVFTVPATMHDKDVREKSGNAIGKNNKDMIFEVIVTTQTEPESFRALLVTGDLMSRRVIAGGGASESMGEALDSLLRLTVTEMGTKNLRAMLEPEARPEGVVDKKFL